MILCARCNAPIESHDCGFIDPITHEVMHWECAWGEDREEDDDMGFDSEWVQ